MENLFDLYLNILCTKQYQENLVDDLRHTVKSPWNVYDEQEVEEEVIVEKEVDSTDPETCFDLTSTDDFKEVDDILSKAEALISGLNISEYTSKPVKKPIVQPVLKTQAKPVSKQTEKSIKPPSSQIKKQLPVYMKAPFKTEAPKNTMKRSSSVSIVPKQMSSLSASSVNSLNKPEMRVSQTSRQPSLTNIPSEIKPNIKKQTEKVIIQTKEIVIKRKKVVKSLSLNEIASSLTLPQKLSNLLNQNKKLNTQIEIELKHRRELKNPFMDKLNQCLDQKEEGVLRNNYNLVLCRHNLNKSNEIIQNFMNNFREELNQANISKQDRLILLLKLKIFVKKCIDFKVSLDGLFQEELENMNTNDSNNEELQLNTDRSNFSCQVNYETQSDLVKRVDLIVKNFELKYKIYLMDYLIKNYLNQNYDEMSQFDLKYMNILIGLILDKPTVIVK